MRIEKATTSSGPHEAHKRLVGEAVEILDQGPEDFYKLLTDVKTAGHPGHHDHVARGTIELR